MPTKPAPDIIAAAIDGYKSQKTRIAAKSAEVRGMRPSRPSSSTTCGFDGFEHR
jgi:hypothetical protein